MITISIPLTDLPKFRAYQVDRIKSAKTGWLPYTRERAEQLKKWAEDEMDRVGINWNIKSKKVSV